MSNPSPINSTPLESRSQLVEILEKGSKTSSEWRIGTELEMFGFALPNSDHEAFSSPVYEGGIEALLKKYESLAWGSPIYDESETAPLIGLIGEGCHKGKSISLEPSGQFELSGAPVQNLFETNKELTDHFELLHKEAQNLGYGFSPLGFHPLYRREEMPWMPKARYEILRKHLPVFGNRGDIDTLQRTCTVQVNLDFSSEQDMRRKMLVSIALQPIATAIFANSPFIEGKLSGYQSIRGQAWVSTDKAESGQPYLFFEENFSFEQYVDWVLKSPMAFIRRNGKSLDVIGNSFIDWIAGKATGILAEYRPTLGDFEDLLTTLYPDVRLKTFLEMRGADAGCPEMMTALPAFWTGLLYDQDVLEEAERIVRSYPQEVYQNLYLSVPKYGIRTPFSGGFISFLKRLCDLSEKGLLKRKLGEEKFLFPIKEILEKEESQSDFWIEKFKNEWDGDVRHLFIESAV